MVLAVLLALGWYLSYTAVRLDRLHTRLDATASALEAQLIRRAHCAIEFALAASPDPASAAVLIDVAEHSLEQDGHCGPQRCEAESSLTSVLRVVVPASDPNLHPVAMRVRLARRFHNEAVAQTLAVREQRVVRLFHLAGHTDLPAQVTFDDGWPPPT